MPRFLAGLFLTTGLTAIAFGVGGAATASYIHLSERPGLYPAIPVVLSAIGAGVVGCLVGICLSLRLSTPLLFRWSLAASLLGTVATVYLFTSTRLS